MKSSKKQQKKHWNSLAAVCINRGFLSHTISNMQKEAGLIMELDLQLYSVRTDLAVEAKEMAERHSNAPIPGVNEEVEEADGIKVTRLSVADPAGSQAIGRAIDNYVTLEVPALRGGDTGL
jgi:hypothetical protein